MDIVFPGQPVEGTIGESNLPSNYDIVLYRGDYLEYFLELQDDAGTLNLTGYVPSMELKTAYDEPTGIEVPTSVVQVDGVNNIRIYFPSTLSRSLTGDFYIYDLQLSNATGDSRTFLTGDIKILSQVTDR